jgi:hypothetical protein
MMLERVEWSDSAVPVGMCCRPALFLSSMGTDLAIDEFEAAPGIGDLLTKVGRQLREKVAVFEGGGFGVQVQLGDLAGEQRVPLNIECGDVALGVLDLTSDAQKLGCGTLACDGGVDLPVIVKETLQSFRVTAVVSLVGAGHQQSEVLLLGLVAREVGVNALGDLAKKGLEGGRWIELFGFVGIAECGIMCLLRSLAGILSSAAGGVGVVEVDFTLGDACFHVIEFCVEDADLAEVTPFKGLELGAELGKFRFAFREPRANGSKLLALVEEVDIVRGLLKDDFGWHMASRG